MQRYEDLIGKIVLAFIFAYLAVLQFQALITVIRAPDLDLRWLQVASRLAGFVFLGLVTALTILRSSAIASSPGWEPRLTSIAGTFCMMLPVVMPTGSPGRGVLMLAGMLLIIGSALSVWCASFLGRSFSVMASARKLVVSGPYAYVRHPLYVAESVAILGGVLTSWSVWAALLGFIWLGLQFRRTVHEEAILQKTFPDYAAYADWTPRFIPRLARYRPGASSSY